METFCNELPKIELHAHLNGSLSEKTLRKLGVLDKNLAEYQRLSGIFAKTSRTLDECFDLFKVAHNATKNKAAVYTATASVIQEFCRENCVYLELRTTPREEAGMTKQEYLEAVITAIKESSPDILVKLLVSIDRRHGVDVSLGVLDLIAVIKGKYPEVVVGVDLSGNPNEGGFYGEVFVKAREMGLFVVLHCGEVRNDDEVLEMLKFGPDRIGHGTFIHPDYGGSKNCWNYYMKSPVPIECCLTSNIACGTVSTYDKHHIKELLRQKLPFSISTDDKGVFCTSLSQEYYLVQKHFNLTKEELWKISYSSIDYSFASRDEKEKLRKRLNDWKLKHLQDS